MPTERELRNIELVKRWADTWNNAVDRMVDEFYAPDCVTVNMRTGAATRGREQLRHLEHAMLAFEGTRRMELTRIVAMGDVVAAQMDAIWGPQRSKACVFLTFNDDGQIVLDNSYGEDPSGASTPGSDSFIVHASA